MDNLNLGNVKSKDSENRKVSQKKIRAALNESISKLGIELSSDLRKEIDDLSFKIERSQFDGE